MNFLGRYDWGIDRDLNYDLVIILYLDFFIYNIRVTIVLIIYSSCDNEGKVIRIVFYF